MKQWTRVMVAGLLLTVVAGLAGAAGTKYTCPMHPQIIQDRPGDCPICNMKLVPFKAEKIVTPVMGQATVTLPRSDRDRMGIATVMARNRPLVRTMRVPGRVAHDPELYSAFTEYRSAAEALRKADNPRTREALTPMVDAARLRLAHYGLAADQLDELATPAQAEHLILPGDHVWVYASVFEQDLPWVRPGQHARITVPALPGESFEGDIRAIEPMLDPMSRTATVRVLVRNSAARELKLEMFASVEIAADRGTGLTIPREAVLDTGTRQLVYVAQGDRLVPRKVRLGPRFDGLVQVLEGLKEGEPVVSPANFLLDAESQIKAGQAEAAHAH